MTDGKDASELEPGADLEMVTPEERAAPDVTRLRWNEVAHPRTAAFATREAAERYKRGLEAMGFKVDVG